MRNKLIDYIIFFFLSAGIFTSLPVYSQNTEEKDSIQTDMDLSIVQDSIILSNDSIHTDSVTVKKKKKGLEAKVDYQSKDSIIFTGAGIGHLFGEGKVSYEKIELDAEYIRMHLDSSVVYATGRLDSVGEKVGYPVFKDGGDAYNSESITYNFDTGKGFITNVITEQGEGYITAGKTKKMPDGSFFMSGGRYTTCDNHDHPHFYINLTKAKVRPKKNVVAGPAYLVIEDVPLPLALPFGFFPFTSKYSSGIIMPTPGDEMERGFYLRDGGYYFAFSDYVDLALTGEIYTKGSWGLRGASTYAKRYKYRGSVNASYIKTITGDKLAGDYAERKDFSVKWSHQQDAKANPNQTFSASVDFSTSGYNRNNLNSQYNANQYTQNTKRSAINYSRRFFDGKLTLNANTNITQVSSDSTISLTLPSMTINTTTIYPFKRKNSYGNERWYEKISFTYQGSLENRIKTKEDQLLKSSLTKDYINGMKHSIPIQASFTIFDNINISPSFNYTERWYGSKVEQSWDEEQSKVVRDTVYGFNRIYDYNFGVSVGTQVYGFFKPMPFLGDKVEMIRHTFRPSVSFNMRPDFGADRYGFYKTYDYIDENGDWQTKQYNPYENGIYGNVSTGRSGNLSFSLDNTLEMKVKSDKDSTGVKKISIFDKLSISSGYDFVKDSLNWNNISASLAIKVSKSYNLNISANFDPYTYKTYRNESGKLAYYRSNTTQWEKNRIPGRLTSMTFSIPAISWNNDTFKKKKDKKDTSSDPNQTGLDEDGREEDSHESHSSSSGKTLDSDGYVKWEIPWSFNLNYNISLAQGSFNYEKEEFDYKWNQSLSFGGSVRFSKNWNFSFSSNYNFDKKEFGYTSCSISRDLHCWTMSASFVPIGPSRSYMFNISVKSSLLKDLKWDQRSSQYNRMEWY